MFKKLSCALLLVSLSAIAKERDLTPANHPRNFNFYVCYQYITKSHDSNYGQYQYYLYHYHNCMITQTPCEAFKKTKRSQFGLYRTYPLAVNAFYRCAYS